MLRIVLINQCFPRNSTDVSNATAIVNAIQVYAIDPSVTTNAIVAATSGTVLTVTADEITATHTTAANSVPIEEALEAAGLAVFTTHVSDDITCKSKTTWTQYTITITVNTNGTLTFAYGPTSFSDNF